LIQLCEQAGSCKPLDANIREVVVVRPDRDAKVNRERQDVNVVRIPAANPPLGFGNFFRRAYSAAYSSTSASVTAAVTISLIRG
jgi:hypothetical protein